MTPKPTTTGEIALYLDAYLTSELMDYVVARCRELGAKLLCLAPPPSSLRLPAWTPIWTR